MKRKRIRMLAIVAFTLLVVSVFIGTVFPFLRYRLWVKKTTVKIEEPGSIAIDLKSLMPQNVGELGNITLPIAMQFNAQAVALADTENKELLIIFNNGAFVSLDLISHKILRKFDFSFADKDTAGFSADGSRVITFGGFIQGQEEEFNGEKAGYQVWDILTGEMVRCYSAENCKDEGKINSPVTGLLLSPDGRFLFSYHSVGIEATPIEMGMQCPMVGFGLAERWAIIGQLAISSSQDYIAYLISDGVVTVESLAEFTNCDMETEEQIPIIKTDYTPDTLNFVLPRKLVEGRDLSFDPTDRWLAALTDNEIVVWSLQRILSPQQILAEVSDGTVISFDRTGDLLALGTKRGITIYDVVKGKQIAEFNVGEVTALYFTRDNRLLVWGDAEGNIHLWGVPKDE